MALLYHYLISGYGNLIYLAGIHWTMAASQVSGMVIVLLVHSIFIYRIWILSRRERIAIILPSVLVLVNTGFESVLCFSLFNDDTWTALHSQARSSMAINAAASLNVAVDVVVTATLIYYLRKGRGSGQRADRLIARLQAYIINSGAITAAASVSVLLTICSSSWQMIAFYMRD